MSMITLEQFQNVMTEFTGAGFKLPLLTEHNANVLMFVVDSFFTQQGRLPNSQNMAALVIKLAGSLQWDTSTLIAANAAAAAAAQAEEDSTPPHASDKSLAWLTCIEDYVDAPKEKIARFCQPAARGETTRDASGLTLGQRFDERVTWLQSRKVHRPKKEEQPDKVLTPKERLAVESNEKWIALNNRINAFGGNRGYLKSVTTFRERLHRDLRSLIDEGKPFAECEAYIAREIKTREDGSIR